MRAMVFQTVGQPLLLHEVPRPVPGPGQVLVKVSACGVCRTDLHVVDGELAQPKLPLIPGHEIVGQVEATGEGAGHFEHGERVGIPWLGWTCGKCVYCLSGRENLCDGFPLSIVATKTRRTACSITGASWRSCAVITSLEISLQDVLLDHAVRVEE